MSLSESLMSLTKGAQSIGGFTEKVADQPRHVRWSLGGIFIIALYLLPWWPDREPVSPASSLTKW